MDSNVFTTIASAIGVLLGIYTIVNRTEDRLGKRIDETKETLRAEIKATSARIDESKETLRAETRAASSALQSNLRKELFDDLVKHIDNGISHIELLLRLHEAEHHKK